VKQELHIKTRAASACPVEAAPGPGARIFDLTAECPDYAELLEQIFAADAVHVW